MKNHQNIKEKRTRNYNKTGVEKVVKNYFSIFKDKDKAINSFAMEFCNKFKNNINGQHPWRIIEAKRHANNFKLLLIEF